MTDRQKIQALKYEMRNYKYYLSLKNDLDEKLDEMWYDLAGVRAADPSKIPINSYNPSYSEEVRLSKLEKIELKQKELERVSLQIKYIDDILYQIEEDMREPARDIYINGKTFYYTSIKHGISASYLQYRIDKNLMDIIKKGS